jgi:MFS transporter, PPP family, 3-phenylpropionic acid transporter
MAPAWRLRLTYWLYYGASGAMLPYFAPYLRGLHFSGAQIGATQMLGPLVAPVAALSWAARSDRTGAPQRALRQATLLSFLAVLFLPSARTPLAVGAVVLFQALGDRAVVPLLDTLTMEHVRSTPGASYARIRLAGSIGFAGLALLVGAALAMRGERPDDPLVPWTVVLLVAGYALASRSLPHGPALEAGGPGLKDAVSLLADRRLLLFLGACALHWMCCAPYHLLLGVHVRELHLPSSVTGEAMFAGVAAEVAVLLWFPRLEARASLRTLFAVAFAASALRWWLVSKATGALAVVALQLFHGLTFGLFWGCAVAAMGRLVPRALRATGQALFTAVVFGGGNALGYALAGWCDDRLGEVAPVFALAAALELVPLGGVLLLRTREHAWGMGTRG